MALGGIFIEEDGAAAGPAAGLHLSYGTHTCRQAVAGSRRQLISPQRHATEVFGPAAVSFRGAGVVNPSE